MSDRAEALFVSVAVILVLFAALLDPAITFVLAGVLLVIGLGLHARRDVSRR